MFGEDKLFYLLDTIDYHKYFGRYMEINNRTVDKLLGS